jgi:hypothetical protein
MLVNPIRDRDILVAIFNAITGLAEKLTGEKMVVFVSTEDGDLPYRGVPVAWLPIHQEMGVEGLDALQQFERSSTPPESPQAHDGIPQEHYE